MRRECFWKDPGYTPSPSLEGEEKAEFLIVGGGIGGLFAAHFLLESGVSDIVLIEKHSLGAGATGHSAGMLMAETETSSWARLAQRFGTEGVRAYFQQQLSSVDAVRLVVKKYGIDCEFNEEELLFLSHTIETREYMEMERHVREAIGAQNTFLGGSEAQDEFGSTYFTCLERLEKAVSVNPLTFAHRFGDTLRSRGVRIFERTSLRSVDGNVAFTSGGTIRFRKMIRAIGTREDHAQLENFLTTICVTERLDRAYVKKLRLEDKDMFFDMERRSYHYGKLTSDDRLLIGYGDVRDRTFGPPPLHEAHVRNISRFMKRALRIEPQVAYAWSGRFALSKNLIPVVTFGDITRINGAGTQVAMISIASYAVARLLGQAHALDHLYSLDPSLDLKDPILVG